MSGIPGVRTISNFLRTAMMPVGRALYIYGGGWNREDTGSSAEARTLGLSPLWGRFFDRQDGTFSYRGYDPTPPGGGSAACYYPHNGVNEYHGEGLDCSGYLGWVLYNTFETESGREGYVVPSSSFAERLADRGWGRRTRPGSGLTGGPAAHEIRPGDIMSMKGHVWISLGSCPDGSIVIAHSSPTESRAGRPGGGMQISAVGPDGSCEAFRLADRCMAEHLPGWYGRYMTSLKDPAVYLAAEDGASGLFTWDTSCGRGLTDPEGVRDMTAAEVLEVLF